MEDKEVQTFDKNRVARTFPKYRFKQMDKFGYRKDLNKNAYQEDSNVELDFHIDKTEYLTSVDYELMEPVEKKVHDFIKEGFFFNFSAP